MSRKMSGLAASLLLATMLTGGPAWADKPEPKPLPSKHQAVSDAVTMLEKAKKTLETDTSKDTANHKTHALADIEKAMQELRDLTQGSKH